MFKKLLLGELYDGDMDGSQLGEMQDICSLLFEIGKCDMTVIWETVEKIRQGSN